jgi:hypothetical protein
MAFLGSAGYTSGRTYLLVTDRPYNLFSAEARLTRSLNQWLDGFAAYQLYSYSFDKDALLPVGVPSEIRRNAVMIGLTVAGTKALTR